MKRGIALPALLLVASAAVPWLIGLEARDGYDQLLGQLRRNGVQVVDHQYEQGWLSATAVTELRVPGIGADDMPWRAETRVAHLSPGLNQRPIQARTRLIPLDGGPAIVIDSHIGWNGASRSNLALAASGESIGQIDYRPDRRGLRTRIDLGELSIPVGEGAQYSLYGLNIRSDSQLGSAGLRLGDFQLRLAGLDFVTEHKPERRQLRGLDLSSRATVEQGRLQVLNQWRIAAIGLNDLTLTRVEASIRLDGLSSVLLARSARVLPLFFVDRLPPGNPELALAGTLLSNFTRLLQSEPSLTLERLRFATADGDLDARLHWLLKPPSSRQALDPDQWLRRLVLEGELTISEPLARRLMAAIGDASVETGWLDDLLRQGLLRRQERLLSTAWLMRDGALRINGHTIPLSHWN